MVKLNLLQCLLLLTPILINATLIVWLALVVRNLKHDSISTAYLIFIFRLAFVWHIGFILVATFGIFGNMRLLALVYGVANSAVLFLLLRYCFIPHVPSLRKGGSITAL